MLQLRDQCAQRTNNTSYYFNVTGFIAREARRFRIVEEISCTTSVMYEHSWLMRIIQLRSVVKYIFYFHFYNLLVHLRGNVLHSLSLLLR